MTDSRDLGPLGESTLRMWCNQVKITPQKAETDRHGWDFILEFPSEPSSLPYDLHPAPIKCWVQVKSTDTPKGNRDVKLSNWQHFVNIQYPAFFLTLEFDGQDACQRAYLVHVGKEYIYKTLKRLREKSLTEDKLNESTMSFDYSSSNILDKLDGHSLKREIEKYIPDGMNSYIKWKSDYRSRVGYENGTHIITLGKIISSELQENLDFEELFVELQLGRISNLKFEGGEVNDVRFDIISPQEKKEILQGEVYTSPLKPFTKLQLIFANSDYSARVDIECEVVVASSFSGRYKKGEMRSPFLVIEYEFDFVPEGAKLQLNEIKFAAPEFAQPYSLSRMNEFASLMLLINTCTDQKDFIRFKIVSDDGEKVSSVIDFDTLSQLQGWAVEESQKVRYAFDIAKSFDMQDKINVSISQLLNMGILLDCIAALVNGGKFWMRFGFNDENHSSQGNEIRVVGVLKLFMGNYTIFIIYSAFGNVEVNDSEVEGQIIVQQYKLKTNNIIFEKKCILAAHESSPFNTEQIEQEMSQKYPDDMLIILPLPI